MILVGWGVTLIWIAGCEGRQVCSEDLLGAGKCDVDGEIVEFDDGSVMVESFNDHFRVSRLGGVLAEVECIVELLDECFGRFGLEGELGREDAEELQCEFRSNDGVLEREVGGGEVFRVESMELLECFTEEREVVQIGRGGGVFLDVLDNESFGFARMVQGRHGVREDRKEVFVFAIERFNPSLFDLLEDRRVDEGGSREFLIRGILLADFVE